MQQGLICAPLNWRHPSHLSHLFISLSPLPLYSEAHVTLEAGLAESQNRPYVHLQWQEAEKRQLELNRDKPQRQGRQGDEAQGT